MKIVFFTFYFPPDLSAGSFRSIALTKSLSKALDNEDEIHVITTHPNRYPSHFTNAKNKDFDDKVTIHRINVPSHKKSMISQSFTFLVYAFISFNLCRKIEPDFIIGTSSRLMTAALTAFSAKLLKRSYFIDLRDIFSETISEIFYQKNRLIGAVSKYFFTKLEKNILSSASLVNVVSENFTEYFQENGIETKSWTFFPNGVDSEFRNITKKNYSDERKIITLTYAGNVGEGQGLEKIIPKLGIELGSDYQIIVIGDGGTLEKLKDSVSNQKISNIKFVAPVDRSKLVGYYLESDILFLHLNNLSTFKRVLPSKIFEYGSMGKPILAGLSGYSADFVRKNIPYASIFEPCNCIAAMNCINKMKKNVVQRDDVAKFIDDYDRNKIMDNLVNELLVVIKNEL